MIKTFLTPQILLPLRNIIHPWHRRGKNILSDLEKSQWFSTDQLHDIQTKKLRNLCSKANSNCNYYNEVFHNLDINPETITLDNLHKLPLLTKKIIRDNFESLINISIPKEKTKVAVTGGSSGTPLKIIRTKHSYHYANAVRKRNKNWTGYHQGMPYFRIWGAPTDVLAATQKIKGKLINWLENTHFVNAFNITEPLLKDIYHTLAANPEAHVESYSSILYEFTSFIEDEGLPPLDLHSVVSSAGTLYDFQREAINRTISANLFNRYGCREVGNIAHECEAHTGMHINMERYIVEILEADNTGNGKIVVTDLENEAFPMLRYVIEDNGRFASKPCSCGRNLTLLAQVTGRTLDVIITPDGRKIGGELFPHLFKDFPEILAGQVIQKDKENIEILLRLANKIESTDFQPTLADKIKEIIGDEMILNFKIVQQLTVNKTGKYRPVINNLLS